MSVDDVLSGSSVWTVVHGLCPDAMRAIPDQSIDAIVSDPIYPEIDRHYGRISEADWHVLMRGVVAESRRVLKPSGSAVFILQPNSERVGRMRPWLWEFMSWTSREWNMVQDAYWWNYTSMPSGGATHHGLLRGSLKPCVWLGAEDCWRSQLSVGLPLSEEVLRRHDWSSELKKSPSGRTMSRRALRDGAIQRGYATPFNVLPLAGSPSQYSAAEQGHGAGTPYSLAAWWIRYICPPGGVVLDPFGGAGTMAEAARDQGRRCILIEKDADSVDRCHRTMSRPPRGMTVPKEIPGQGSLFDLLESA